MFRASARSCALVAVAMLTAVPSTGATAGSREAAVEGEGFEALATIPLDWAIDAETTEVRGRSIVLGTAVTFNGDPGGLVVADVEDPATPRVRSRLGCTGSILDVVRTSTPTVLAVFASPQDEPCLGLTSYGFALVDVSRPGRPRVVSSTPHDESAPTDLPRPVGAWASPKAVGHPTQPIVYTTRVVQEEGEILVWSLDNEDTPELVARIPTTRKPYAIDVNDAGTVLVVAQGAAFTTYDVSNPSAPAAVFTQQCPGCTQTTFARFVRDDSLVVHDESPNPVRCPAGALYFYALDLGTPRLTGVYDPTQIEEDPTQPPFPRDCTVADFDVSSDGKRLLVTWHDNTVRLLDVADTSGAGAATAGTGPVTEAGWFRLDRSRVWSARFGPGDSVLAVDLNAGLHTLRGPSR